MGAFSCSAAARLLQADMLAKARAEFDSCIERVSTFDEFMAALDRKHMCLAPWCACGLRVGLKVEGHR